MNVKKSFSSHAPVAASLYDTVDMSACLSCQRRSSPNSRVRVQYSLSMRSQVRVLTTVIFVVLLVALPACDAQGACDNFFDNSDWIYEEVESKVLDLELGF
jgi:hypothetical protein